MVFRKFGTFHFSEAIIRDPTQKEDDDISLHIGSVEIPELSSAGLQSKKSFYPGVPSMIYLQGSLGASDHSGRLLCNESTLETLIFRIL